MSTATMSITERRVVICLKLAQLQRRMPMGWEGWSHTELIEFRADLRAASRCGSVSDLLLVAGRIATAYGEPMALIDPCHGQAA
ncbi:hypothetical protein [Polaromonas sp.]|uniref:hypothetical protein n=1 Tax=Polaromonas sp. TaxID=1869339 RepID=UPI002731B401|nr:hypothetical protein [Polaromonas sp.]MDP1740096.1 hypothetical protein [Polaromonas sp.]